LRDGCRVRLSWSAVETLYDPPDCFFFRAVGYSQCAEAFASQLEPSGGIALGGLVAYQSGPSFVGQRNGRIRHAHRRSGPIERGGGGGVGTASSHEAGACGSRGLARTWPSFSHLFQGRDQRTGTAERIDRPRRAMMRRRGGTSTRRVRRPKRWPPVRGSPGWFYFIGRRRGNGHRPREELVNMRTTSGRDLIVRSR